MSLVKICNDNFFTSSLHHHPSLLSISPLTNYIQTYDGSCDDANIDKFFLFPLPPFFKTSKQLNSRTNSMCIRSIEKSKHIPLISAFIFSFEEWQRASPNLRKVHHQWWHNKLVCTTVCGEDRASLICRSFQQHSWHWANLVCWQTPKE